MTTLSSEINDLFLTRIKDYRLDSIFEASGSFIFNTYLEPWLMDAANEFDICDQDLTYITATSTEEGYFSETLTTKNKILLSKLMVKYWMNKTVQDILQVSNFVTDRDFKTFSAAQNLRAKQDYYESLKEELSQELVNYGYKINDWGNWRNQLFDE